MNVQSSRRAGLAIFGLLSLGDISTIFLTDGKSPPYAVAAFVAVLGLICLVLVGRALKEPSSSLRLLTGLRVLSAVVALPAFVAADVPVAAQVLAGAVVTLTALGVALVSRDHQRMAIS